MRVRVCASLWDFTHVWTPNRILLNRLYRAPTTTQPDADCYNLTLTHKVLDWDQNQVPIHDWRTPTRNARRKLLQAQDNAEGSVHIALLQLLIHLRPGITVLAGRAPTRHVGQPSRDGSRGKFPYEILVDISSKPCPKCREDVHMDERAYKCACCEHCHARFCWVCMSQDDLPCACRGCKRPVHPPPPPPSPSSSQIPGSTCSVPQTREALKTRCQLAERVQIARGTVFNTSNSSALNLNFELRENVKKNVAGSPPRRGTSSCFGPRVTGACGAA